MKQTGANPWKSEKYHRNITEIQICVSEKIRTELSDR